MTRLCFLLGEATAGTSSSPMEDRREKKVGHIPMLLPDALKSSKKRAKLYEINFYLRAFIKTLNLFKFISLLLIVS